MVRIFVTAFEPYDGWDENASWLTLVEFTKHLPPAARVTTRRYPVDFYEVQRRLERDLQEDYDYALHLGQAPGASSIRLEAIGINVGGRSDEPPEAFGTLVSGGPIAYRSQLPLIEWTFRMREIGIPAAVSYHAGTYLCNAILYLTHHFAASYRLRTRAAFLHVPLDTTQAAKGSPEMASLPASMSATALRMIVDDLATRAPLGAAGPV